jgi:primary-amine oxidase
MGFSLMPFGFFSSNPSMGISNPDFIREKFPKVESSQPKSADPTLEHQ